MGQVVLGVGTSHSPGQTGMMHLPPKNQLVHFYDGVEKAKNAIASVSPDLIIVISNEHFVNFYDNNYPALCIGTGPTHFGPVDYAMIKIPKGQIAGHPGFATQLLQASYDAGFDPARSEELSLDHGHMIPYHTMNPSQDIPLVPIIVNALQPPMPTPKRLYQFGQFLRNFIQTKRPKNERVAIVAGGGIAHDVGTPRSGWIDQDFDHKFLEDLEHNRGETVSSYTHDFIAKSGNGAHEVRNWIAVMGALGDVKGKVLVYEPVVEWVTGSAVALWEP